MTTAAPSIPGPADAEPGPDLLPAYRLAIGAGYDEAIDRDGVVRPHWRAFMAGLRALPATERASRSLRLDRRVRETGIAFDIFADPSKPAQRWRLDLAPVIFGPAEWQQLATALIQRARLFDAMLGDLYGAQRLLSEGLLPPDLVFGDATYLRPVRKSLQLSGQLHFYAADLARGADGHWRVIDTHTETPAGLGFALANRVVHTHIAGDLFKRANAVRLAEHFQHLQAALTTYSGRDNPRIALLTPGAHHPDYFSHAYLARYLGTLLVEGSDLVIKGNRVALKTLEGLKDIDLIVRCVDGRFIDPLELDPGGFDGPAGMLRAVRREPRVMVNAVGSGLTQNRGLGGYLPALSRDLLGEDLLLADAPRRWLGDADNRRHVLQDLDNFVIRPVQEGTGRPGQATLGQQPRLLSADHRRLLARDIELHGATLVAEEKISFSTAPVCIESGLVPMPFALRVFVTLTPDGYRAMPGGLAMTIDPDRAVALSAPDGHTRDVWVLSDNEQMPHVSLWRPTLEKAHVERSQRAIQSRVADNLFWLGRYSERLDWTMRVMRSALRRVAEDNGPATGRRGARKCLELLIGTRDPESGLGALAPPAREIGQLLGDLISGGTAPRTLERTCAGLHRNAHMTRDRLSLEAWQTLSKFGPSDVWSQALTAASPSALLDLLDEGLAAVAAFNGLMHENMTRNFGWSFLDMGRRLERAFNLSEAMFTLFVPRPGEEEEQSSLLLLLELADSFITYRSRYRLDPLLPLVLDLLMLDETNPRSLGYQLSAILRGIESLPDPAAGRGMAEDRRIILGLSTALRLADIEAMTSAADGRALAGLLREHLRQLPEFSNALSRHYFNLTDDAPHRVQTRTPQRP